ncbi:hypothetical protein D3C75_1275350 [compost metagenome]
MNWSLELVKCTQHVANSDVRECWELFFKQIKQGIIWRPVFIVHFLNEVVHIIRTVLVVFVYDNRAATALKQSQSVSFSCYVICV